MTFPLTPNPTWEIRDSSKLTDYITCPRMYFFMHILGWRKDIPAHDLHFGEAWHHAREHQLLHGYDDIKGAYLAFINCYRKYFSDESDVLYQPKDPMGVLMALQKFAAERKNDLRENEVLSTEVSGTVPVDHKRKLYYRMDSILRNRSNGKIFSWDHKSATEKSMNYRGWASKFLLCIQNFTYTHCLYCMYPIEDVLGIEFCGTAFGYLKKGSAKSPQGYRITFQRVPAFRPPEMMNVGLWMVLDILDAIDRDMERLFHCSDSDKVLMSFNQNPESCTKYWGCAFHDFCLSWPNPLRACYEPPLGFREEFWNPAEKKTTNHKDLEWRK